MWTTKTRRILRLSQGGLKGDTVHYNFVLQEPRSMVASSPLLIDNNWLMGRLHRILISLLDGGPWISLGDWRNYSHSILLSLSLQFIPRSWGRRNANSISQGIPISDDKGILACQWPQSMNYIRPISKLFRSFFFLLVHFSISIFFSFGWCRSIRWGWGWGWDRS